MVLSQTIETFGNCVEPPRDGTSELYAHRNWLNSGTSETTAPFSLALRALHV